MKEAVRLAKESVDNRWGGPFGAVIVQDGEIVARGQNRVLLTGDVTSHAEIEAIRKAIQTVNPYAPSISVENQSQSTLELIPRDSVAVDRVSMRARMLTGMILYTTGQPCPMCMGAIYWARLDACFFGCDVEMTRDIGFDDAFQYEEFQLPIEQRRIEMRQIFPDLCSTVYREWMDLEDRHYY
jgi:guanine deaminase